MSMSYDDCASEQAILELHYEAVMEAATLAQCIYVFVEGDSEEQALPILLERAGLDLTRSGIIIANYNGIGNLKHALRLLSQTLSHDCPVIVTYDNDKDGKTAMRSVSKFKFDLGLVSFFPIPVEPVVRYRNGDAGGSFEEAFEPEEFINACFLDGMMEEKLRSDRPEFEKVFDASVPWLAQVSQFCRQRGQYRFESRKVELSEELAERCEVIPKTFSLLAAQLRQIRKDHPVKHPDDVELPQIPGLTC